MFRPNYHGLLQGIHLATCRSKGLLVLQHSQLLHRSHQTTSTDSLSLGLSFATAGGVYQEDRLLPDLPCAVIRAVLGKAWLHLAMTRTRLRLSVEVSGDSDVIADCVAVLIGPFSCTLLSVCPEEGHDNLAGT